MVRRLTALATILAAAITSSWAAPEPPFPAPSSSTAQQAPAPTPSEATGPSGAPQRTARRQPAPPPKVVTVKDGRLSVSVRERHLDWVVAEIGRAAQVAVDGVTGYKSPISIELKDVTVDEALRAVLADRGDYFLRYETDPKKPKPAVLKAVWLYARGASRPLQPVPPSDWASTRELRERLADPDPQVRLNAIQGLVERDGPRADVEVQQTLRDPDRLVRMQALYAALENGVTVPDETLRQLAVSDPSRDVRVLALDGLAQRPDGRDVVQQALNDPDPIVRNKANEVLRQFDRAAGVGRPPSRPQSPIPSPKPAPSAAPAGGSQS